MRVFRCPLYVPLSLSGLRRCLHLGSFALSSALPTIYQSLKTKPDLVLVVAPTLLAAPIGLAAARMARTKAWLHLQDIEIEAASKLGIMKNQHLVDVILRGERALLQRFDLVSSISTKMLDNIELKGVPRKRLLLLPNWVDTRRIFPLKSSRQMRREIGIREDRCMALYAGSMGLKQGLEVIIGAARECARLPGESPLFVLSGDGPARPRLEREAQGLSNVMFMPLQPADRFNEFLNAADVALVPQQLGAADLVMPSKLGAIFAAGKPVVATVAADSQIALDIGEAGLIVPPEDAKSLAIAVRGLAADPDRRNRMGIKARALGMRLDTDVVMKQAEERVLELCRPHIMKHPRENVDVLESRTEELIVPAPRKPAVSLRERVASLTQFR
jgi:colanic acid biosynthesis glycosyl transferase WcaI